MKKILYLSLLIILNTNIPLKAQTYGFVNIFRDDFNGSTLKEGYYHHGSQTYNALTCIEQDDVDYSLGGGQIHLKASYTPGKLCNKQWNEDFQVTRDYSFDQIITHRRFKYGRYTIRAYIQKNSGLFPAFWLFGVSNSTYYSETEIDIFEVWTLDEDAKSQIWLWKPDKSRDNGSYTWWGWTPNVWATYTLEWTPTYMRVLLNGNVVSNLSPNEDLFGSLEVILGNQIGSGDGIGNPYSGLSNYLDVDYMSIDYPINTNETVNVNQYSSDRSEHTAFAGKIVNMSPNNGSVVLKGKPNGWTPGSTLDLVATDKISLKPGFHAEETSTLRARIVTPSQITSATQSPIKVTNTTSSTVMQDKSLVTDQKEMEMPDASLQKSTISSEKPLSLATVYPNPTNGILYFELRAESASFEIYSSGGVLVFTQELLNGYTEVDIQSLSNGIYVGRIISKEGVKTIRIIKE